MKSYLRSQGLWQVASGGFAAPAVPATGAAAEVRKTYQDDLNHWHNKDDSAFGSMMLRIANSHHHLVSTKTSSRQVWETLQTSFGTQGPSLVYTDFRSTLQMRIPV
jgi:hypothetical protein